MLLALLFSVVTLLAGTAGPALAGTGVHITHDTTGDYISLTSVSSPDNAQGDLAVVLTSTSAVTTVSVHVYDSTGTTDLLDPAVTETSSTPASVNDPGQSTWTVATPITQTQLPLGTYLVVVDATDSGGTAINGLNQQWGFSASAVITATASNSAINFDNPTATVTGSVVLVDPDGTQTPYEGTVSYSQSWDYRSGTVQTDAGGNFTLTVSPNLWSGANPALQLSADPSGVNAGTGSVPFSVTLDPAKLTAHLSSSAVTRGGTDTLSGSVEYQPGGTGSFLPLKAPTSLSISEPYPSQASFTAQTGANGDFSITLPATISATGLSVSVGGTAGSSTSLLGYSDVQLPLSVIYPTTIASFKVSLNPDWELTYSGCFEYNSVLPNGESFSTPVKIAIQWAESPTGPWHTLTSNAPQGYGCGSYPQDVSFGATVTAPVNYAYYRAVYAGQPLTGATATTGGFELLSTSTSPALAWKYADRIASFSLSPTTVSNGGKITFKGTLQYYEDSHWHDYSGQLVYILLGNTNGQFCVGGYSYCWVVRVKTNSSGRFSATVSDQFGTDDWVAQFDGSSTHLATDSPLVRVRVR